MPKKAAPEVPAPESSEPEPQTPPHAPPHAAPHSHRFFTWVRSLRLVRQPGWIGGVAAGIADRIGVDVVVVRGILVVVALLGGPAVLLYALAWLVLPDTSGRIHLEDLIHGKIETPVVGIAILVALSLLPIAQGFWWFGSLYWGAPQWGNSIGRAIWTLVVLGLLAWFVVWFSRGRSRTSADAAGSPSAHASNASPDRGSEATAASAVGASDVVASAVTSAEPTAPVAPRAGAPADEIAAWRTSQDEWKVNHDAYRRQQLEVRHAAARAAADAAQAERAARAAAFRERQRLTRSHPLYSAALIGTALLAGAITTLAVGGGAPTPVQWLVGTAVAVGVLGIGIMVNGAIGRRSGGASGVAVLLALVLLVAGVFPQTQALHYFGSLSVAPTQHGTNSSATYVQGFGDVRVDLESYYSTPRPTFAKQGSIQDEVNIVVLSGNVTVLLPADEYQHLDGATAGGHITTWDGKTVDGEYSRQVNLPGDPNGDRATRELDVDIHVLRGTITFIEEETN
jgi:phage shock protein PspC (stress-responsive transcriptional regulator)